MEYLSTCGVHTVVVLATEQINKMILVSYRM